MEKKKKINKKNEEKIRGKYKQLPFLLSWKNNSFLFHHFFFNNSYLTNFCLVPFFFNKPNYFKIVGSFHMVKSYQKGNTKDVER